MSVFDSADPATVERELEDQTVSLDTLGKALGEAVAEYNEADEAWLVLYDAVAEDLQESYRETGRKSDPAEHVIVTATRRQHRAAYTRWKRAKRQVELLEKQMMAARQVVSARQTQANGLRDEMKMGTFAR